MWIIAQEWQLLLSCSRQQPRPVLPHCYGSWKCNWYLRCGKCIGTYSGEPGSVMFMQWTLRGSLASELLATVQWHFYYICNCHDSHGLWFVMIRLSTLCSAACYVCYVAELGWLHMLHNQSTHMCVCSDLNKVIFLCPHAKTRIQFWNIVCFGGGIITITFQSCCTLPTHLIWLLVWFILWLDMLFCGGDLFGVALTNRSGGNYLQKSIHSKMWTRPNCPSPVRI